MPVLAGRACDPVHPERAFRRVGVQPRPGPGRVCCNGSTSGRSGPDEGAMGNGEHEFTAFYDATWARTVACAYAVTGDVGAAEEVAQEAYSRAWPRWSKLATYDDPGAWVRQVATRQAISRWRRGRTAHRFLARSRPPGARTGTGREHRRPGDRSPVAPRGSASCAGPPPPGRLHRGRDRRPGAVPRGHRQGAPLPRARRARPAAGRHSERRTHPCLSTRPATSTRPSPASSRTSPALSTAPGAGAAVARAADAVVRRWAWSPRPSA